MTHLTPEENQARKQELLNQIYDGRSNDTGISDNNSKLRNVLSVIAEAILILDDTCGTCLEYIKKLNNHSHDGSGKKSGN